MDDESGESTELMEEVPLKELGESESGASRGILLVQIQNLREGAEVTNVACKQSTKDKQFLVNVPLKLLSPKALFSPKCTKYRLEDGLYPDPLGELTALP